MEKQVASILIIMALLIGIFAVPVAAAAGTMNLTVSSPSGQPGGEVTVNISVANNPGLASLKFDVAYDSALTLKNVTFNSAFGAYATTPTPYKNPQTLTMISPLADVDAEGVFATLTFMVSADAQSGYEAPVTISCSLDDFFNSDYEPVQVAVVNGAVNVADTSKDDKNMSEVAATTSETNNVNSDCDEVRETCQYISVCPHEQSDQGSCSDCQSMKHAEQDAVMVNFSWWSVWGILLGVGLATAAVITAKAIKQKKSAKSVQKDEKRK